MKPRLLALALVLLPLCFSCRKDGKDPDTLKGFTLDKASSERLHQSLPADATGAASVTFEAPSSWRVSARETRSVSWLTVEPDHGEAGTATVSFTMAPNGEPAARTAEITFSCEGGSFTMTITQEGQSAVEPSGQEKHPFVAPGKRMSYAAQLDDTGQESSIYAFAYSDDGKVSKIRSYENVQDGLCHPGYTSVIDFTRTGETVRFEWIENRMTGARIPFDEDGTVTIGGKKVPGFRIMDFQLDRVPIYQEDREVYECVYRGSEMDCLLANLRFSYDGDGNLLSLVEASEELRITAEWKDGNLLSLLSVSPSYNQAIGGPVTTTEETEECVISYTDLPNPFTGVSINTFLLEDLFGLGPFLDDGILGIQTRNLPERLELSSSTSDRKETIDFAYTFDDQGRVTSASSSVSGAVVSRYRFHYAEQAPVIGVREDDPRDILLSQSLRVEYDETACANAVILQCVFGDGHSAEERFFPTVNYLDALNGRFYLYPGDPDADPNVTYACPGMPRSQYDGMQPVTVRFVKEDVVAGEPAGRYSRKSILYELDYGSIRLYARVGWHVESHFDYIAWWDGTAIQYTACSDFILEPRDALLQPASQWYLVDIFGSTDPGKAFGAMLNQPLQLVWKKPSAPVNDRASSFIGEIYLDVVTGGN